MKTRFSYAFPKEFPYRMNHVSHLCSWLQTSVFFSLSTLFFGLVEGVFLHLLTASKKLASHLKLKGWVKLELYFVFFLFCFFQILECEFYLLELMVSGGKRCVSVCFCFVDCVPFYWMQRSLFIFFVQDCCLIVYHPYRPLLQYVQDMGQEDMLLPLAWYGSLCSLT